MPARSSSLNTTLSFEVSYRPPRLWASGRYDDLLVRTPDGWRIKERTRTVDQPLRDYRYLP